MHRIITVVIIGLIALFSTPVGSAFSGETDTTVPEDKKVETIKELKENISGLEFEKRQLKEDWEQFLTENGKLQDFLKEDIPEEDEFKLKEILDLYGIYKQRLDNQLEQIDDEGKENELKKELLSLKQDLYKKLVYFIKIEKLEDYLTYIKWDLEVNEKRKDVSEEIDEDKKKLEEKVQVIRDKIQENKKVLDERIKIVLEKKLDEKISEILNDERFMKLDTEAKKHLFIITLEKLRIKRQEFISIKDKTSLVDKKIEIYNIIEEKLIEVMNNFDEIKKEAE